MAIPKQDIIRVRFRSIFRKSQTLEAMEIHLCERFVTLCGYTPTMISEIGFRQIAVFAADEISSVTVESARPGERNVSHRNARSSSSALGSFRTS